MNYTQPGGGPVSASKFCTKCGGSLAPGAKFCPKCGAPVRQTPSQEPTPPQRPPVQQTPPQEPPVRQASPQRPPVQQVPPQKKRSPVVLYIVLAVVGVLLVALLATLAYFFLSGRITLQESEKSSQSQTDSDRRKDRDRDKEQSSMPNSSAMSGSSQGEAPPRDQEPDYDTDIWDNRLPAPPAYVYQQYYVIYYEGSHDNQIEMAVFDLSEALGDNCLLWNQSSGVIALKDDGAMTDLNHYFYTGDSWVGYETGGWWITIDATDVISSNLDIRDGNDRLLLPHITAAGISKPIDFSYYEPKDPEDPGAQEYMLPGSDSRYLTRADLEGLTADECRIARNEIYARHGRMFADEQLQAYFDQRSWYVPRIQPNDFTDSMLNEYDLANLTLILAYEKEMGYRS